MGVLLAKRFLKFGHAPPYAHNMGIEQPMQELDTENELSIGLDMYVPGLQHP